MDSRDLEIFLLLAETLHFGRAAEHGNLSPSALSRTIQRLESELDCRLFDRGNREVRLTEMTMRRQSHVDRLVSDYKTTLDEIMVDAGPEGRAEREAAGARAAERERTRGLMPTI